MKQKKTSKGQDFETAKEICRIVNLIPPEHQTPDISDLFEKILTDPTELAFRSIDKIRPHLETALRGMENPIEDLEYHEFLLQIRSAAALTALGKCCEGLPSILTDHFDFRPVDTVAAFHLLRNNRQFRGEYKDFELLQTTNTKWFTVAMQFAEILDACHRYSMIRSNRMKLKAIAGVGYFMTWDLESMIPLMMTQNLFQAGSLTVKGRKIALELDEFTNAFLGVPIERIKECKACKRVFWADRIDMKGCSPACAKNARMRKWRSKPENREREQLKDAHRYQRRIKDGTL